MNSILVKKRTASKRNPHKNNDKPQQILQLFLLVIGLLFNFMDSLLQFLHLKRAKQCFICANKFSLKLRSISKVTSNSNGAASF